MEALDLLKTENATLQAKVGAQGAAAGGPQPKKLQDPIVSLRQALGRAKHIIQVLDQRRK